MTQTLKRGAFIVFEGLDRCGKTTQINMLKETLDRMRIPVHEMTFPDRSTQIGTSIDGYLRNTQDLQDNVIHLLFSANRWEKQQEIRRLLESGTTIICSRYAYSGVAYSNAKGLDLEWCRGPDRNMIAPDLLVFLDIDPEQASKRNAYGEERYEKIEFQRKVRASFMQLFEIDKQQQHVYCQVVDASRSIDEVHQQIKDLTTDAISKAEHATEIAKLWPL